MRAGFGMARPLVLALGFLTGLQHAGSAQATKKPSIMMRWPNLVIAIRASDTHGVTVWLGPSLDALPEGKIVHLRDGTFRPDALDDWLPFAQFFLEEKGPVFGPGGTRASPVLTSERHRLLAFSQEAAPPPTEPDYLLFFADSGGSNRLIARATRDHLREFLSALRTARASAGWAPDTAHQIPAVDCMDEKSGYQSAEMLPGNQMNAPLKRMRGQGIVLTNYVIDPQGRAEPPSLDIIYSDHKLLSEQVRKDLSHFRFKPAACHGVPIRQLVSQAFVFKLGEP